MNNDEKKLWLESYKLANIILNQAPWEVLHDNNFLSYLDHSTGKLYYGSVLGNGGVYKGIFIADDKHINNYLRMYCEDFTPIQLINYQEGIMVSFLQEKDIRDDDKIIPRDLGITFDDVWITFKKYEKGYLPSNITINDLELLNKILENFIMLYSFLEDDKLPIPEEGKMLCRYFLEEKKIYNNVVFDILTPEEIYPIIDVDCSMNLENFNLSDDIIEVEFINFLPIPTGDNYCDNRYKLDLYYAITNASKDKIIDFKLFKESDYNDISIYYNERISDLINFIIDNFKPKVILVRDEMTKSLLSKLGEVCNIDIVLKNKLDVIDNFLNIIMKEK